LTIYNLFSSVENGLEKKLYWNAFILVDK